MAEPMTVTITIADNPLAGRPGQANLTMTVSSEPDLDLPEDGSLPDPESAPLPVVIAFEMVRHVTSMMGAASFVQMPRPGGN